MTPILLPDNPNPNQSSPLSLLIAVGPPATLGLAEKSANGTGALNVYRQVPQDTTTTSHTSAPSVYRQPFFGLHPSLGASQDLWTCCCATHRPGPVCRRCCEHVSSGALQRPGVSKKNTDLLNNHPHSAGRLPR